MTALFAVEGALMSLRFAAPVVTTPAWWMLPLIHAPRLLIPGFLAVGSMAILGGTGNRPAAGVGEDRGSPWSGRLTGLLAHLAMLMVLIAVTVPVCDGNVFATSWPMAWVLGWYAAGLAVMLTWLAALHPDAWSTLSGRRVLGIVGTGLGVVLGGFGLSLMAEHLWAVLASATFALVRVGLSLVCADVVFDPTHYRIGTSTFAVRIAPACSGYEGIGLVWAFLAAYLAWSRRSLRWPHAWLLIPLGTVAIWLVNSARIIALILIGAWVSPEVALGGFHSHAGSLGFLVISLGLVLLSRRSAYFMAEPCSLAAVAEGGAIEVPTVNPTASYLMPFLAVVATTLVTGAMTTAGFDPFYPLRIIAGGVALWVCHRSLPGRLFDLSGWAMLVGVAVFGLWIVLEPANPTGSATLKQGLASMTPTGSLLWLGFRVVGSIVVVPLVEEWAFRGYLTRRLIATDFESVSLGRFTWFSFLLSSLAFGLLHGRWFAGTLAGLVYAGVYYRRGRVGDAALAHAVTNACIALTVLLTGDWAYWS